MKVHVEHVETPAALENILDDCNVESNVKTIYKDDVENELDDILEVEVNKVSSESYNEEEWESNKL